ncbi:hypothetical protein QE152_g29854 [Popillia japonica]|uniref:Uncharacterized protein n=1 Tax=Popillia japonica TaxID=7064 RepID=A0AAW1JG83_POPJA
MWNKSKISCVATALILSLKQKEKKKRRWMKDWFKKRDETNTHENLLRELKLSEPTDFRNFLRLDGTLFDELLRLVTPEIRKQNTIMRDAIPPSQRLSITL